MEKMPHGGQRVYVKSLKRCGRVSRIRPEITSEWVRVIMDDGDEQHLHIGDLGKVRRRRAQPNRSVHVSITIDDPGRSWKPEEKTTDEAMNAVFDLLIEVGLATQNDIAHHLAEKLDVRLGTARAYTSASLLYFREAGLARYDNNRWTLED